jgi:site-specific recombinase XerD
MKPYRFLVPGCVAAILVGQTSKASIKTADSDYVFAGHTGKSRWEGMILKDHILPAATKAEIGKVGWHTLRHTYRESLKRRGTSLEVQKELRRHANIRTTAEIYGLDPDLTAAHREANTGVVKMLLGV